ncbi:glycerophosphodiester phosphodiesterase family protein [Bacteroides sp.]
MSPSKGFAENSLITLKYNMKYYPCSIQEIDVRITSDGIAVLSHDNTLDRTTNGKGSINQFTYAELQKLNLKDIDGNVLPNDRIPLLEDALNIIKGKGIAMLDMKPGTDPEIMMNIIKKTHTFDDIIVICYSIEDAQTLNKKYPNLILALGFNSKEGIERNKHAKLPYKNLIALVPKTIQEQSYYDSIRAMGIPISFSAQNKTDLAPDASEIYKTIYKKGITILCTDSITKAYKAFNP